MESKWKNQHHHSSLTYDEVASHGPACRPLDFPAPIVVRGVRVNALVVHPASGSRQVCSGVIHRESLIGGGGGREESNPNINSNDSNGDDDDDDDDDNMDEMTRMMMMTQSAYWPQRRLQDAIYGSVWACLVLQRHYGPASLDAARAAGVEPGSPNAPIVWEITPHHVAIKMVEWSRVHQMRGRLLEDPVKEVAAMQLLGQMTQKNSPHVLTSIEVLQDGDFLYSVMPYCAGGDLFGVVVQHAEDNGGEGGMTEPVARYWFRQILIVSATLPSSIHSSIHPSIPNNYSQLSLS
jgi:serine/threonine protein kinase